MLHSVRRALPALLLALAASASAASAALYIPTKETDSNDGSCDTADCSLREAIVAANQRAGEDVILLGAGTYTLSIAGGGEDNAGIGDLDISDDLVLAGEAADRTAIHGNRGIDRIFHVLAGATVEIRDVTLAYSHSEVEPGAGGGAILNNGVLTLLRSEIWNSSSRPGPLGTGDGGAIHSRGNEAVLVIRDSTLSDNTSQGRGGAIAAGGRLELTNVTIAGNQAAHDFGGGLYIFSDARATLNNVTLTRNRAAQQGGGLFIENSAFIGTPPEITNTIVAGNLAPSHPDCSGAFTSRYNLIGIGAGCVGPSAANNDKVGTAASPVDPKLPPLPAVALDGGPTRTAVPGAGSAALNAGSPAPPGTGGDACEAADQRGAARGTAGAGRCDIGAVEVTTVCVAGGTTVCLHNGRFRVKATFQLRRRTVPAVGAAFSPDAAQFSNGDLTVKVVNDCAPSGRYVVAISGVTNLAVTVTVEDLRSRVVKTYTDPAGDLFRPRRDTAGFFCAAP